MKIASAFLAMILATVSVHADAIEEVRQAETGFAKAFADRDKAKFFSYVADDAVFMNALQTQRGKDAIVKGWSRYFDNVPVAPFRWGPERVEVTGNGKIGFSMGPIYDPAGVHVGYYSSIWQKQADGTWKVIVDGPAHPSAPLPASAAKLEDGRVTASDGAKLAYRKVSGGSPITLIVPDPSLHDSLLQFADVATIVTYEPRKDGTNDQHVADLEALRAHLKTDKFIPLGHAQHGGVIAAYAAKHPEHVSRVIELAPAGAVSADDAKKITVPVLLIHSDKTWAQSFADARVVAVPSAWRDDPVAVYGAIRHFLRREWPLGSTQVGAQVN